MWALWGSGLSVFCVCVCVFVCVWGGSVFGESVGVLVSVLVSVMCCSSVIVCIHPERLNNVRMYNVHPKLNRL